MRKRKRLIKKKICYFIYFLIFLYGCALAWLFYNQALIPVNSPNNFFESDIPKHIEMSINGTSYSILELIFKLFAQSKHMAYWISAFLTIIAISTVFETKLLLRFIMGEGNGWETWAGALLCSFIMPAYVNSCGSKRYISYQSGNMWHNPTYLVMKCLGILILYLYFIWRIDGREKLNWGRWLLFSTLLTLCTAIKPSFFCVFAPIFSWKLFIGFIQRKNTFLNMIRTGSVLIPSCIVILWQSMVLFGGSTEQGIRVKFFAYFGLWAERPLLTVICSILFSLVVFLLCINTLKNNPDYLFAIGLLLCGFLQAALLIETGERMSHGNFIWGYSFAIYIIQVFSVAKWFILCKCKSRLIKIGTKIATACLIYQSFCGVYFFIHMLQGQTYLM